MIPKQIRGYHKAEWGILIVLLAVFVLPVVIATAAWVMLPADQASVVISTVAIILASISLWVNNDD